MDPQHTHETKINPPEGGSTATRAEAGRASAPDPEATEPYTSPAEEGTPLAPEAGTAEPSAPSTEAGLPSSPDMAAVLRQLPLPRSLKDWVICLRKPALSLGYRVEKRHIPDLDAVARSESNQAPGHDQNNSIAEADGTGGGTVMGTGKETSSGKSTGMPTDSSQGTSTRAGSSQASTSETSPGGTAPTEPAARVPAAATRKGQNSDLMTLSGGFTIRYFDLAVGVFGLLLAGCLFRGCCWVKRKMK